MTTEEFIEAVNALSEEERGGLKALDTDRGMAIVYANQPYTLAYLPFYTKQWVFVANGYTLPGSVLKLMGELVDGKYREREKKYVILNGEPEKNFWLVFIVSDYGWLDCRCADGPDNLDKLYKFSYTREELEELKEGLSPRIQKAVDAMTVTLDEALKMGEDNDN